MSVSGQFRGFMELKHLQAGGPAYWTMIDNLPVTRGQGRFDFDMGEKIQVLKAGADPRIWHRSLKLACARFGGRRFGMVLR
jgi:hypothetical protein